MAGKKENIKALFTNTRSRVIIVFTVIVLVIAVIVGLTKLIGSKERGSSSGVPNAPGMQSIPGALDPTIQYAKLQEAQNQNQAQSALQTGGSAIPTIVRSQALGAGVQSIGSQNGQGGLGFTALSREDEEGVQKSQWIQEVQNANCSKASVNKVLTEGAQLADLKNACSCIQLRDDGLQVSDLQQVCSCKELKAAGFNARQLKDIGFSASRLRACGFDACELRNAGFSAQEMKDGGFSDGELKGAGFTDAEIAQASGLPSGVTETDVLSAGCQADALSKLRSEGVSASAIRRTSGCSAAQLKAAGFNAQQLKDAGFTAADLKNAGYTVAQLKQAGFSGRDLLNAGFTPADLANSGFTPAEISAAESELPPGITAEDIQKADCDETSLRNERLAGVSAKLIRQYAGCSAQALKAAGFSNKDLANAGFTPQQINTTSPDDAIRAAGCDPVKLQALFAQGISATRIHQLNGCSASQLKAAGYDGQDLLAAGFTPQDLAAAGFTPAEIRQAQAATDAEIRAAGCDPSKLNALLNQGISATRIHELNGCNASQLKAAGYNAKALSDAGFTPQDLAAAGFSADQIRAGQAESDSAIKAAGCDPAKLSALYGQGVSAQRIYQLNGCSAAQLKAAGFDAQNLLAAGFTPQDLAAAGFTPQEIKAGSPGSDEAIRAAGCDPAKLQALRNAGVSATRIHELNGCSAAQLKAAGYDATSLINAGFTPQDLAAAGFTPAQISAAQDASDALIKAAGCDPTKLANLYSQGVSAERIHQMNGCSAAQLKAAGFDARDLLAAGFTPQDLAAAGFTPAEIKAGSTGSDAAIRAAGCDPARLQALYNAGVSALRIHQLNGCSAAQLKAAGYDATALTNAGFTPQQLGAAGFTPAQIKAGQLASDALIKAAGCDPAKLAALYNQGVSAGRIHQLNGCSAAQLKAAGFDARDLLAAGFTPQDLAAAGFTPAEIKAGSTGSDAAIRAAGCDPAKLQALYNAGVSALRIHQLNGCSAAQLKAAGYDATALTNAGFTPQQLAAAGFTPAQIQAGQQASNALIQAAGCDPAKLASLYNQGVSAERIHQLNGCSAAQLKAAGFDAKDLVAAGFSPQQLLAAGFTPEQIRAATENPSDAIQAAGCDPVKLKALYSAGVTAKQIHDMNGCSAAQLNAAGFNAKDLLAAGFTPQDLIAAGFTPDQIRAAEGTSEAAIRAAGCDPTKLKVLFNEGVSAQQIHTLNGCNASQLKAAGYAAKDLLAAGFTPQELLTAGFSQQQLAKAGLTHADLIAAGRKADCSVTALTAARTAGISASTIRQTLGCDASALKAAGFSAAELKAAGFTAAELKNAGFSAAQLKAAGYSAKELRDAGFTAQDLKDAGFTASQLKEAGFTAADLKAAGYSASQLKDAGFSAKDLKSAGFGASELKAAGFSAKDLKDAGYTAADLQAAGFSPNDLQDAGYSTSDIQKAGYSNADLANAGIDSSNVAGLDAQNQMPGIDSTVPAIPSYQLNQPKASSAEAANSQQLQQILSRQNQQLADQKYQQKIQQRASEMLSAANQSLNGWKKVSAQAYVGGAADKKAAGNILARGQTGGSTTQVTTTTTGPGALSQKALIKTGDILFAVIDTSINSDEPGPILATIVAGKYKNAKLIGSFTLPANADKMVISFNTLSVPGANKTTSITAIAIDANTARTALSSSTNHHYMLRYGSLFASSFLEGFGNAFQSADTTVTIGGTGGGDNITIQNGIGRSALENAVIGLATVGKSWGQVAQQQFNTPVTVQVYSGTGIGVLFTQDLFSL